MGFDFDCLIDRRRTDSLKWRRYGGDVLPMWVADMDFASPQPVIEALRERVEHGVFGYACEPAELREVIVARLRRLYGWYVEPEDLVFVPGVVTGFNMATQAVTQRGDGVLVQTPVYPPFLHAAEHGDLRLVEMELKRQSDGRYVIDYDQMEHAVSDGTRVFILCNPHNPIGRVYGRDELARMAEICLRHDTIICSDEIHADFVYEGRAHVPIASLDSEIAAHTVTLMAPSKTFNIAGLQCSVAIIPNADLRDAFEGARRGIVPGVNLMGYVAALAAYRDGQPWLDALLQYLQANRDYLVRFVEEELPGVTMASPEGTYLAWLDCRGLWPSPQAFFLDKAHVALGDGAGFGRGGEHHVRLNFGCCRQTLTEALERMRDALRSCRAMRGVPAQSRRGSKMAAPCPVRQAGTRRGR